ncbi:MAG TPA: class I SAM-dependent methyltransferase [Azospirillaceae bacterium]|nr:class I SAM-dependent methyltransferase [Azospirillaceae bacterium]
MSSGSDHDKGLVESWHANAGAWSRAVADGAIPSRRLVTDKAVVEAVLALRPARVLDLGCGEGWLTRALAPHVGTAVGVDLVPELVERARAQGGAEYHVASYAELAADPARVGTGFDVIVANFALLDENPAPLLAALRRIAAPGGRLVIQTLHPGAVDGPYEDGWRTETFTAFDGGADWKPMPWYFRTVASWLRLVSTDWRLESLDEPLNPLTRRPASLLITAVAG